MNGGPKNQSFSGRINNVPYFQLESFRRFPIFRVYQKNGARIEFDGAGLSAFHRRKAGILFFPVMTASMRIFIEYFLLFRSQRCIESFCGGEAACHARLTFIHPREPFFHALRHR